VVTHAFPAADGEEPVSADAEEDAEELVSLGGGDEPEVAGGADWHPREQGGYDNGQSEDSLHNTTTTVPGYHSPGCRTRRS